MLKKKNGNKQNQSRVAKKYTAFPARFCPGIFRERPFNGGLKGCVSH